MSKHIQVGCGAAILKDGALLLVRRRRDPEADHWGLPGGKIEFGEEVKDAVVREVLEELGIAIHPGELLCVVDQIADDASEHWIAPVFLATSYEGEPAIAEDHALSGMGFFSPGELPEPLTKATRQALAALMHRHGLLQPGG